MYVGTKRIFAPPREMKILSVVQIMFMHPRTSMHSSCKVDISRLNQKLQKLQREGMIITGVHVTDLEREKVNIQKQINKGGSNV